MTVTIICTNATTPLQTLNLKVNLKKENYMKAQELRIGNWVTDMEDVPVKVTGINFDDDGFDGYYIIFNGGKTLVCDDEDSFVFGIPLTPELLVKCGARTLPQGYFIGKLKFTYEHNELSQFVRFHWSGKVAYIKYLHQLQNLYHALTQTEIEIKF